jgi:hypothetical protein
MRQPSGTTRPIPRSGPRSPIDLCSDIAPPNISHAYNAQPCSKFLLWRLLAWPRRLSPDMLRIQMPD